MGNKTNPIGLRLLIRFDWEDSFYVKNSDYKDLILQNYKIRSYFSRFKLLNLSKININRSNFGCTIILHLKSINEFLKILNSKISDIVFEIKKNFDSNIRLDLLNIKDPILDPNLIAVKINEDISNHISLKASVKKISKDIINLGADGIKVIYSGRINGEEIAKSEWYIEGKIPLHTLSADICYTYICVSTNYGVCGTKVWICLNKKKQKIVATKKNKIQEKIQRKIKEIK